MNTESFILVVGLSGVGKTTFCNYLSKVSDLKILNSGNALRNALGSVNINVQNRIETGDIFLNYFSEEYLYKIIYDSAIKTQANIIDGIRLQSTLKYFLGNNKTTFTIFIEATETLRQERFLNRLIQDNTSKKEAEIMISKKDSYFEEVISLKKYADFIIDNNNSDLIEEASKIWKFIAMKS